MFFGVDYYPEQWVFPYSGTADNPEGAWERDAGLMAKAGVNVVRIGEYSWGICEPKEGKYDFLWLRRVMEIMEKHDIKVVLGTPTAAPPLWLSKKYPGILPLDEHGLLKHAGTRRAQVTWSLGGLIERQVEREHIDAGLAQEAEGAAVDMVGDELAQALLRHIARLGDARTWLQQRVSRRRPRGPGRLG